MIAAKSASVREQQRYVPHSISRAADRIVYAGIAVCSLLNALFGAYHTDADTVAYLDISDAIRNHDWHSAINANWFPLYPALLALAKACFGFRMQYELMAARLLDAVLELAFVAAAVVLAQCAQRFMLARGVSADQLLPERTLCVWSAIVAYFLASLDLNNIKPDTLVSTFMILSVAALLHALTVDGFLPWLAVGLAGALAFWSKSFAFPFFCLMIFFAALAHVRRPRVLLRLALASLVFALLVTPLVRQISALRGRFTIGEAGRLDMAWYVNHADRFNPVDNAAAWQPRSATARLKHPGELLSLTPSISYYGGPQSFGSTPQWTDLSYWSDGLAPRFVPLETLAEVRYDLSVLGASLVMRFQVVLLAVLLAVWGFQLRRASFPDPMVAAAFALPIACIGLYAVVYLEARYIIFALVLMATLYAACATSRTQFGHHRSLQAALVMAAALVLLYGFQTTLRESKAAAQAGARPMRGAYNSAVQSAGAQLASLYPNSSEVACMGDAACWADPYWAHYAGLRMTAVVETGHGIAEETAEEGCTKLEQNPAALDALRGKNIRAIVARFAGTAPCSAAWKPLGSSPNFFYLPL